MVVRLAVMAVIAIAAVVLVHYFNIPETAFAAALVPALKPGWVNVDYPGPTPRLQPTFIQNLDGMTTRDYLKYFKDGIKDAQDIPRYYTRIWAPGTTIAANDGNATAFFQKKVGDEELSLDGGTSITLTDYHTNMMEGGKIEKGTTLIVDSLQLEVTIPHREFNGFSADLSPSTAVVTATDTSSATAHMLALDRAIIFELWRGKKQLGQGTLSDFPSEGGFFGAFGGSTPEGYIQNGFGQPSHLRETIVLNDGYLFTLKARVLTAITNVLNVEIRAKLSGLQISTVG
jgi:hypothetical protein